MNVNISELFYGSSSMYVQLYCKWWVYVAMGRLLASEGMSMMLLSMFNKCLSSDKHFLTRYHPQTKLQEGNVLTCVRLSMWLCISMSFLGEVWVCPGDMSGGGYDQEWAAPSWTWALKGVGTQPPGPEHGTWDTMAYSRHAGWYASHLNTFVYIEYDFIFSSCSVVSH